MNITKLTNEQKVFIRTIFREMRLSINKFMEQQEFVLSNSQLFTFLSYVPASLAIASDGTVDESEIASIEKLSKSIDVNSVVNIDLMEMMAIAFEPENCITNEEFNIRAGSEILFLARNCEDYEDDFIKALKALLTFDFNPKKEGSLTSSFGLLMDSMIENNISKNKDAEKKKIQEIKQSLGI